MNKILKKHKIINNYLNKQKKLNKIINNHYMMMKKMISQNSIMMKDNKLYKAFIIRIDF